MSGHTPAYYAALEADNRRLTRELAHMRDSAGPDSCADYAVTNAVLKELLKRCRAELIDDGHNYDGLCPEPGRLDARDPDCAACTLIVEIERETT